MPDETNERTALLRSLTAGQRILFLFDAARHPDQVAQVMPAEPRCMVIVTSRRDLAGPTPAIRRRIQGPAVGEALEMLAAAARIDWIADAEAATEIVEMCGRLPLAIRSAAERVTLDGTPLRHVADLLRPPTTRLAWLQRAGRGVRERIDSEYRRLSLQQRTALCLLSTVETPTFVSWLLVPLMKIKPWEADNIVASLVAAQLLDEVGRDEVTEVPRYQFNVLVRLFAERALTEMEGLDGPAAAARLDEAMVELVDDVLVEMDRLAGQPDPYRRGRHGPRRWLPETSAVHRFIAAEPDQGVRTEYQNLVRLVRTTAQPRELRWRVAAALRGCIPHNMVRAHSLEAFEQGRLAAMVNADPVSVLDVELAQAGFLIAVEDYAPAFEILDSARLATERLLAGDPGRVGLRDVQIVRLRAEAYLQMGAFRTAAVELVEAARLAEAEQLARTTVGAGELRLIRLLQAENHAAPSPDPSYAAILESEPGDSMLYRVHLGLSEAARRRGYWADAERHLWDARANHASDARRAATVHYRLARLHIDHWRHARPSFGIPRWAEDVDASPDSPDLIQSAPAHRELAVRAVSHAAQAVVAFRAMGNQVGTVRAECQYARALVIAGRLVEAEQLCHTTWSYLAEADPADLPSRGPLLARFARAAGELMLHRGMFESAWRKLSHAATMYASHGDWTANAEVWLLLNELNRTNLYPIEGTFDSIDRALAEAVMSAAAMAPPHPRYRSDATPPKPART